jgi:acyl phosphate:glycerol-3-phosphate acyltransferase
LMPILFICGAYLLGAVPCGLLIGWSHGVDVRTQGSRNIGATNVGRVVGRKWGLLCLALDILKGLVPTLSASLMLGVRSGDPQQQLVVLLVAVAAVLGHVFPIYLRFRGGKGVATTIGVALGIWPYYTIAMGIALAAYALVRFGTGLVSAGSLALAIVFPVGFFAYTRICGLSLADHWPLQAVSALLGLVILVRHRENIRRLVRGEEMGVRGAEKAGGSSDH